MRVFPSLCFFITLIAIPAVPNVVVQASEDASHPLQATKDIVWNFDEPQGNAAQDSAGNRSDPLRGSWRWVKGVTGSAVEFDGYTTQILRPAKAVPALGNEFTISAWVALNNYPWNWVPIVDQSELRQVGYSFGIDAFGHLGFAVSVGGVWQTLVTTRTLPLKKWAHATAVFDGADGLRIFIDGESAGTLRTSGEFWQAVNADLLVGRVRNPEPPFPSWLSHPQDPILYSLDGDLDDVKILGHAVTAQQDAAEVHAAHAPANEVIPYAVLPSGPPGAGPFGAMYTSLAYDPPWDRLRRIGADSDVIVRFEQSAMRLVFWQGTNYIPAWVTQNGKWYTDEFLETWGAGCPGAGDCEPMSDKQGRYSRVSILASSPARAIIHWRYSLAEARNYVGAYADPLSGWTDWADEYWTVYPDGVAVRRQELRSSAVDKPHEWQETIIINGPGQRPEDNIDPDALTLANMSGQSHTYHWEPKTDHSFTPPNGPSALNEPKDANIQVVHLKSKENPFQIVWPRELGHDTYNDEPSFSMFEWWNHWPVAQVGSSGRPAVAPDRASHTSLSHIFWAPYAHSADSETKLLLCGLTTQAAADLVPLAKSWLSPPPVTVQQGDADRVDYDPAQRAFVVHRRPAAKNESLKLAVSASHDAPLLDPAFEIENWNGPARIMVTVGGAKSTRAARTGVEHHPDGDSLILYLPLQADSTTLITIEPVSR